MSAVRWLLRAVRARRVAVVAASVVAALVSSSLVSVPVLAAPTPGAGKAAAAPDKSTPVSKVPVKAPAKAESAGAVLNGLPSVSWPSAGSADSGAAGAAPGGLPVRVLNNGSGDTAPRTRGELAAAASGAVVPVHVTVADQHAAEAAGVRGVVLQVSRADGQPGRAGVGLSVSYAKFASAYGADYGSRLRLVSLPDCALTTPSVKGCQEQTPIVSTNDVITQTVTAQQMSVGGSAMVVALSNSPTGTSAAANWTATDLSSSYSWSSGTAGGDFSLNYPLKAPASLGGPQPALALGYSSGSVDAKTAAKTGQSSVVGEGWELSGGGYVERPFRTCAEDGSTGPDLCWVTDSVTLVFGGRSVKLVKDANGWHASNDDKLRIESITNDSNSPTNNAVSGEYWKVTVQDGTQYYFGKVHRYVGDTADTGSVLLEPVNGNQPGDSCYGTWCNQAYRWNLDYVVDPRGNSMTYFYDKLVSRYGPAGLPYDLSATLNRIEYGTRAGSEAGSTAPMKVTFTYAERCWTSCTWPTSGYADSPGDLWCTTSTCSNVSTPAHFTRYRLSAVTTQVSTGPGAWRNVDKWDLEQTFLTSGDNISPVGDDTAPNLWLNGLTHTGYAADGVTTQAEPQVTFGGTRLANRTDWGDSLGMAPFMHWRITQVNNGVGGQTNIAYLTSDCVNGQPKTNSDSNPSRCFPIWYKGPTSDFGVGYFNKYVVGSVTEKDLTGGSPDETSSYAYSTDGSSDTALWAHDDVDGVNVAYTSWADWRGYPTVTTTHGTVAGQQTVTKTVYHRGLTGDAKKNGTDTAVAYGQRPAFTIDPLQAGSGDQIWVGLAGGGTNTAGGQCLDILNGQNVDGAQLQVTGCNGGGSQQWQRLTDGTQAYKNPATGKCLDVHGSANNASIWLWTCNSTDPQRWLRQPDGTLKNPSSGRCLDIDSYNITGGGVPHLWDCAGKWNQVWMPTAKGELMLTQNVRCAGTTANTDGTSVINQQCGLLDHTSAQTWQLTSAGTVLNLAANKCLDVNGTAAGSPTRLWTCGTGASQQWQPQADGTLKNPASGRCLDAGDLANDGQTLTIRDCSNHLSQLWIGRTQDHAALNGQVRSSYALDNGAIANYSVRRYQITQTGSRPAVTNPSATIYAFMTRENLTKSATWIAATSSWRWTQTDTAFDAYGLPTDLKNSADVSLSSDDTCTHTDYARNTTSYLVNYRSQSVITDCITSPTNEHYLSGTQTLYDTSTTVGAPPSQGLPTQVNALTTVAGTTLTFEKQGKTTYDQYGRVQDSLDALDHKIMTRYTPATGGPVTGLSVTNALGHVEVSTVEPGHGNVTAVLDANNQTTSALYDPLGRVSKVWQPGRATNLTANTEYTYTLGSPSAVTTKTLGPSGNQITTTNVVDGRFRTRQTQAPAAQAKGGRIVSDTQYDARGLAVQHSTFWDSAATPGTTLAGFANASVQQQARTTYDNQERPVAEAQYAADVLKWQTTVTYDGDSVTVMPPAGGTPARTTKDVAGNVVELRQYTAGSTSGASQATTYTYDRQGRQTKVTDAAGNQWTVTYDRLGHKTASTDPDAGSTSFGYDAAGRLTSTTDARAVTLAYAYDDIDRMTGLYDGSTTGTKRADWTYDTVRKGALTKSRRFVGTNTFTSQIDSYDVQGRVLSATTVLPVAAGVPAGTYTWTSTYNVDGSTATTTLPGAGGLAPETLTYTYDNTGRALSLAGQDTYVADTSYYGWGAAYQQMLGSGTKQVRRTATVEEATGRTTGLQTETQNQTNTTIWDNQLSEAYAYDNAGNITAIAESNASGLVARQCFQYDGLQELAEAWTTTAAACQSAPSQAIVGGTDPYWTSYQYQLSTGNRTAETKHASAGNTVRTYVYPASGATSVRPHAITKVNTTGVTTSTDTYAYGPTGNTETRAVAGSASQTLTWDSEGHTATVASTAGTTTYTYDASGSRLLATDPQGTTAYLPGLELRLQGGTTTATRYYSDVAVRSTTGGLSWLSSDHHGTGTLSINASTLAATHRRLDPYGNPRTTNSILWPSTRGFVNGTADNTGLTHLGAREYESATGRFVSADPVINPGTPSSLNAYSYSANSPVTSSDPSGLRTCSDQHDCQGDTTRGNPDYGNGTTVESSAKKSDGTSYYRPRKHITPYIKATCDRQGKDVCWDSSVVVLQHGTVVEYTNGSVIMNGVDITQFVSLPGANVNDIVNGYDQWYGDNGPAGEGVDPADAVNDGLFVAIQKGYIRPKNADFAVMSVWFLTGKMGMTEFTGENPGAMFAGEGEGGEGAEPIAPGSVKGLKKCNSFDATTLVLMADGTATQIQAVHVGDHVLAEDAQTHEKVVGTVTDLIRDIDTDFADLAIIADDLGKQVTVHTTPNHLIWSVTRGRWVPASQLKAGERLETADGRVAEVAEVRIHVGLDRMYNLTVEPAHTYYVMAGTTPVLVHNDGDDLVTVGRWMSQAEYDSMMSTGMVQRGGGGFTYVVHPASPDAYISARPGSVYVEFDVPQSSLIPGGRPGDYKISDSDTIFSRLRVSKGGAPMELPEAKNIRLGGGGARC